MSFFLQQKGPSKFTSSRKEAVLPSSVPPPQEQQQPPPPQQQQQQQQQQQDSFQQHKKPQLLRSLPYKPPYYSGSKDVIQFDISTFPMDEDEYSSETSDDARPYKTSDDARPFNTTENFICSSDDDSSNMTDLIQNEDSAEEISSVNSQGDYIIDDIIDNSSAEFPIRINDAEDTRMELLRNDKGENKDQINETKKKLNEAFGQSDDIALTCEKIEKVMNKLTENIETITDIQDDDKLSLMIALNSLVENDVLVAVTPNLLKIILENRELSKKMERLN